MRPALGWILAVGLVLAVGGAAVYVIGLHGNFPLGDDWAYAWPVRTLCERGDIELLPWTGASAVVQIAYGAMLCSKLGFSFEVLRASTAVLGVLADLGLLLLLRRFAVPMSVAIVATLAFALTPLRVNLAFTYMTDLPFTAFVIWSAYFYSRGLDARGTSHIALLLMGAALAALAVLIRQHGIFVAAAAAIAALPYRDPDHGARLVAPIRDAKGARTLRRRMGLKPPSSPPPGTEIEGQPAAPAPIRIEPFHDRLVSAIICIAPPLATLGVYYAWLFLVEGTPEAVARKAAEATRLDVVGLGNLVFRAVETLGVSLVPLSVLAAWLAVRAAPLRSALAVLVLGAASGFLYAHDGALMPYLPNTIYDFGVGALTLRDTLFLGLPPPVVAGAAFRWPLTVLATFSAAVLLVAWSSTARALRSAQIDFVTVALILLFGGSLLHTRYYFDRYLLPVLPFAIVLAAIGLEELRARRRIALDKAVADVSETRVRPSVPAIVALVFIGIFSLAGTRDWMELNRARQTLLDRLAADGVTPDRIDGGFEFNAWHLAKASGYAPQDAEVVIGANPDAKSWWWVIDDEYVISTNELAGYDVHALQIFRRVMPPGETKVYALRRETQAQP